MYSETMRNPFDSNEPLDEVEANAVWAILRAAEHLEYVLEHCSEPYGLTSSGTVILNRCFREMRRTIEAYLPANEHTLTYEAPPPGVPFRKKKEGK
jgi:hypothetical protein